MRLVASREDAELRREGVDRIGRGGERLLDRGIDRLAQRHDDALPRNLPERHGFQRRRSLILDPRKRVGGETRFGGCLMGVGGPVGSGKTTLLEMLCKAMRDKYDLVAITNDIYTKEDQRLLTVAGALPAERIMGVETGGCPHTAIREDASINLAAVAEMHARFPGLELIFIESGGDNLAATFSPELADLTIYVIDVAEGEKIPRKGGPGITRSDLLIINKIDLAPLVGANLGIMEADTLRMRGKRPFVFSNLKSGEGVEPIANFIIENGGLAKNAG